MPTESAVFQVIAGKRSSELDGVLPLPSKRLHKARLIFAIPGTDGWWGEPELELVQYAFRNE